MSIANAESYLHKAKQPLAQRDINANLITTIAELIQEIKNLESEVRRVRRDNSRRF